MRRALSWVASRYASTPADWQERFVLLAWGLLVLLCAVLSVLYLGLGLNAGAFVLLGFVGAGLLILELYRVTRRRTLCAHLILTVGSASLTALSLTETPVDPAMLAWLSMVPPLAALFLGWRAGVTWLALSLAAVVGVLLLDAHGLTFGVTSHWVTVMRTVRLGSLVLTVFGASVLFDVARAQALRGATDASRAKSVFLATMSHELRTPMNGVLGMTDLLLREPQDPTTRERLEVIQRSGLALTALLNDVLDFSRIEAGRLELVRAPFDLHALVRDVEALNRPLAQGKGLAFPETDLQSVPRVVRGDELRLRQVLVNLLHNAIKFTQVGTVALLVEGRSGDQLALSVTDTGRGIPPEALRLLFTPFQQLELGRELGGTGLGLALCRQLAQLMGGDIGVQSTPGQGSRFSVVLPLPVDQLPARRADPGHAPSFAGLRVLVVDDNPVNLRVAEALLRKVGCVVETAVDGVEAVARARTGGLDLVLMDCSMPRLDGHGATRQIRGLGAPLATVPIVALTASVLPEDIEACLASGMNHVIAKPVSLKALEQVLAQWASVTTRAA